MDHGAIDRSPATPRRMWICHTCDVPRCINPQHLYRGDDVTNTTNKMNVVGEQGDSERSGEVDR